MPRCPKCKEHVDVEPGGGTVQCPQCGVMLKRPPKERSPAASRVRAWANQQESSAAQKDGTVVNSFCVPEESVPPIHNVGSQSKCSSCDGPALSGSFACPRCGRTRWTAFVTLLAGGPLLVFFGGYGANFGHVAMKILSPVVVLVGGGVFVVGWIYLVKTIRAWLRTFKCCQCGSAVKGYACSSCGYTPGKRVWTVCLVTFLAGNAMSPFVANEEFTSGGIPLSLVLMGIFFYASLYSAVIGAAKVYMRRAGFHRLVRRSIGFLRSGGTHAALLGSDAEARSKAAEQLSQTGWQPGSVEEEAALLVGLWKLEEAAALGSPATPFLGMAMVKGNPHTRVKIAGILGDLADPKAIPHLLETIKEGDCWVTLQGEFLATEASRGLLDRMAGVSGVGDIGRVMDVGSARIEVRKACEDALVAIADSGGDVMAQLAALRNSDISWVRQSVDRVTSRITAKEA